MVNKEIGRPLSGDEKRVLSLLKKIDKVFSESSECNCELFGLPNSRLYMLLYPFTNHERIDGILKIPKQAIAWHSEFPMANGGDEDFEI